MKELVHLKPTFKTKTIGRLYGKNRLKVLSGKASLWEDGHKWRNWLCGREWEPFMLRPQGRVPG